MKSFGEILLEKAKAKGLPVAEVLAENLFAAFEETVAEYVAQDGVPAIAKMLAPAAMQALAGVAKGELDKIDGQAG
jgi:hypothetical protein